MACATVLPTAHFVCGNEIILLFWACFYVMYFARFFVIGLTTQISPFHFFPPPPFSLAALEDQLYNSKKHAGMDAHTHTDSVLQLCMSLGSELWLLHLLLLVTSSSIAFKYN